MSDESRAETFPAPRETDCAYGCCKAGEVGVCSRAYPPRGETQARVDAPAVHIEFKSRPLPQLPDADAIALWYDEHPTATFFKGTSVGPSWSDPLKRSIEPPEPGGHAVRIHSYDDYVMRFGPQKFEAEPYQIGLYGDMFRVEPLLLASSRRRRLAAPRVRLGTWHPRRRRGDSGAALARENDASLLTEEAFDEAVEHIRMTPPKAHGFVMSPSNYQWMADYFARLGIGIKLHKRGPWWQTPIGWAITLYAVWKALRG